MSYQPDLLCVRARKVYDWISQLTNIKLKEKVPIKKGRCIQDNICLKFNAPSDGKKLTLWSAVELKDVHGTFVIVIDKRCEEEIEIFINENYMTTLTGGELISATVADLQLIEAQFKDNSAINYCKGSLIIQLVYRPKKAEEKCKHINCFLSDHKGTPLKIKEEAISCMEHSNPSKRRDIEVVLNGQIVKLQEVEMLIKGFITVEFLNERGIRDRWFVFPFWEVETFYLCAPKGTDISCIVSKMECKAEYISHEQNCKCCMGIGICIMICLNIYAFSDVTLELLGKECKPRFALKATKSFPASCAKNQCSF
ncbi:S-Ena type endospore appendage [Virgibacillus dokdonensis]|uniref:Endospore appendages core domain-containing protein n=1 Tax=Virgibacillus dokdonensis TaxID=302167 RepID=A0A2K9IWH5_9BACI|nr:S-Ena type endospore appendage [Virgibacillus dokdonensis]AUJ23805.1 hypothetical protein A21D_00692 [Virgibacillus dokdonensis]